MVQIPVPRPKVGEKPQQLPEGGGAEILVLGIDLCINEGHSTT